MREVKHATVDRVPAIAEMLARAFVDDPTFGLFVGDAGVRALGRRRFFELLDTPLAQLGLVWEIGDADAAAAWVPPNSSESWASIDASTRPLIRELTADGAPRWEAMWDWVVERIPDEPVWFLDHIGVHPSMQGQGLGRALIDHGLKLASDDDTSAFLETAVASNVPYYEHLGFRVVEHGDTPLAGPHIWLMRRDP